MLKAASCFSGIGAPELGGPQFDWLWSAEIEKFPAAVHANRFPQSINLGDVTADDFLQNASRYGKLDLLVGGPPCQDFSIAGLRAGVAGDRGNLTLRFLEIAHAIRPRNLLVENVPGWLSMPDNAFGCFLAGLVGSDDALRSPVNDGRWPSVGMVAGPRARAAWRVFDAQYFSVAQRRRRVFVVADFGEGADPAAVLFERQGVFGNTPPIRRTGQASADTVGKSFTGRGNASHRLDTDTYVPEIVAQAMSAKWSKGSSGPAGDEVANLVAHSLRGEGFDASEDGTGRGTPLVAVQNYFLYGIDYENNVSLQDEPIGPLLAGSRSGSGHPLPAVAIEAGALREKPNSGPDGVGVQEGLAYTILTRAEGQAVAFDMRGRDGGAQMEGPHDTASMRASSGGSSRSYVQQNWQVRRLTPTECERLQGFPDGFTDVLYRGKKSADGPRYKALGNSWAVPCGTWIIGRIAEGLKQRE